MSGTANQVSTQNYMVPSSGGTHAVAYNDTLSASPTPYDFRQFELDNYPFIPQGAYIDNTANASPAVFVFAPMNFEISVPANSFAAINFPAPKGMTVQATGAGDVPIVWVDYPVLPMIYQAAGTAPAVTMPAVPATAPGYSVVEVPGPAFESVHGSISGAGLTATISPTVAGGNLRKLQLSLSGNVSLAAAAQLSIVIATSGGAAIATYKPFVNNAAGTTPGDAWTKEINLDSIAPNVAGGGVVVTLGVALATGSLEINGFFDK